MCIFISDANDVEHTIYALLQTTPMHTEFNVMRSENMCNNTHVCVIWSIEYTYTQIELNR